MRCRPIRSDITLAMIKTIASGPVASETTRLASPALTWNVREKTGSSDCTLYSKEKVGKAGDHHRQRQFSIGRRSGGDRALETRCSHVVLIVSVYRFDWEKTTTGAEAAAYIGGYHRGRSHT